MGAPLEPGPLHYTFTGMVFGDQRVQTLRLGAPCQGCHTRCCAMTVVLLPEEHGKFDSEVYSRRAEPDGKSTMILKQQESGMCTYYKEGMGCTTYKNRPAACTQFDCRFQGFGLLSGPEYILSRQPLPSELTTEPRCSQWPRCENKPTRKLATHITSWMCEECARVWQPHFDDPVNVPRPPDKQWAASHNVIELTPEESALPGVIQLIENIKLREES